ncbi:MAG TPA: c-type cytochrome domain-containing protein [Flavobacteriales bacterium]
MHPRQHLSPRADRWLTFGLTGLFVLAILLLLSLSGCKHEPPVQPEDTGNGGGGPVIPPPDDEDPCDPNVVYFEQQILPLLISNCAVPGCHNTATDDNDGIQITSYATLMNSGIIEMGDPFDSDLWEVINENDPDDRMPRPPQNPLSQAQIDLIGQWLQQGAQNNSCVGGCDTTNVTYSGKIQPIIAAHCLGCHSGANAQAGLNFSSWAPLHDMAVQGNLAGAIQHQSPYPSMPPSGPGLSQCRIDQILIWIESGAPNN